MLSLTSTKHQYGELFSFRSCFLSSVSSQLSCYSYALIYCRHLQFVSFTAVWVCTHKHLCIRFSGITQGGKHGLIKSSSSPWWMALSIHCCLLLAATQWGASSLIQFKVNAKQSYLRESFSCTSSEYAVGWLPPREVTKGRCLKIKFWAEL